MIKLFRNSRGFFASALDKKNWSGCGMGIKLAWRTVQFDAFHKKHIHLKREKKCNLKPGA